jgi:hypothetical protein
MNTARHTTRKSKRGSRSSRSSTRSSKFKYLKGLSSNNAYNEPVHPSEVLPIYKLKVRLPPTIRSKPQTKKYKAVLTPIVEANETMPKTPKPKTPKSPRYELIFGNW